MERYFAQQALTNEILDLDLPLQVSEMGWGLSAPDVLRATIAPEYRELRYSDGQPALTQEGGVWRTYLYCEEDRRLTWGGILQKATWDGPSYNLEASGFTSYPQRQTYQGPHEERSVADPTLIYKRLWDYVQGLSDGNLGVTIQLPGNCPVRIGTAQEHHVLSFVNETDCGAEMDNLASQTPFDYTERHAWTGVGDAIAHTVQVHYPRAGRRRFDLVFNQDNLADVVPVEKDGAEFANSVYVLGTGEGSARVRGVSAVRDGRLRRQVVYSDPSASTVARANSIAARERAIRTLGPSISQIVVWDHHNARLGAWALGDDIRVEATIPHYGKVDIWHRVVGWSRDASKSRAVLQLARADSFRYGAPA